LGTCLVAGSSQADVKKKLSRGEIRGKASGEEANNRKKTIEVYCPQDYYE